MDGICQGKLGRLACHLHIFDTCFPLESALFASLWSEPSDADARLRALFSSYEIILVFSFSRQLEEAIRKISERTVFRISPRPPVHQRIHVTQFILDQFAAYGLLRAGKFAFPEKKQDRVSFSKKILIHPGSGSPRKNWPIDRFIHVYENLKSEGREPEFIIGPAEDFLTKKLEGRPAHCASDLTDLTGMMKNAAGYIGNDSGLSHLAAFLGLPVTVIFGPSDPLRWKPVGNVRVLRPCDPECNPCFETEKENCANPVCLYRISADTATCMVREMAG
ncbi:MAG: glycosyltransferase family 9 protein [Desulfococcaceae bacterium]